MHQRVRCGACHHWTDALLVWAAGDCCPRCNEPLRLGEAASSPTPTEPGGAPQRPGGRIGDRGRRPPGGLGEPSPLGERQRS